MNYIIAIGLILAMIFLITFILKNSGGKFKKYIIIFYCVSTVIIIAMIVADYVDIEMVDRDRAKYEIIGRTGLLGVTYEGEKEGYYVVRETGLFYADYLLLPSDKVQLSSMCYPGASVLLYCDQDKEIVYDEENMIELSDGTGAIPRRCWRQLTSRW